MTLKIKDSRLLFYCISISLYLLSFYCGGIADFNHVPRAERTEIWMQRVMQISAVVIMIYSNVYQFVNQGHSATS